MNTWEHRVEGRGIHALAPNQTCTCKARHVTAPKEDEMNERNYALSSEILKTMGKNLEKAYARDFRIKTEYDRVVAINADLLVALEEVLTVAIDSLDSPRTSLTPMGALMAIKDKARAAIDKAKS